MNTNSTSTVQTTYMTVSTHPHSLPYLSHMYDLDYDYQAAELVTSKCAAPCMDKPATLCDCCNTVPEHCMLTKTQFCMQYLMKMFYTVIGKNTIDSFVGSLLPQCAAAYRHLNSLNAKKQQHNSYMTLLDEQATQQQQRR